MIIDEEVLMTWNGRNKKHFESKGYIYTKQRDEFYVKVDDLQETSHVKIHVGCDICHKPKWVVYRDYVNRKTDEYLCSDCATRKYGVKTRIKNKLELQGSFADWCIENVDTDFITKYWSDKNTISPYSITFGSNTKVWIKCQEKEYHHDYLIACHRFTKGIRCPECSSKTINIKDSVGAYIENLFGKDYVEKIWSDKNDVSPYEVSLHNGNKFWFKCLDGEHEDYSRRCADSVDKDFSCPSCVSERKESMLQEKVRVYLESKQLQLKHEYECSIVPINPKTNRKLPFDNEVVDYKLICEVMGIQHYYITGFHILSANNNHSIPEDELSYLKEKDLYKKNYALSHGYHYLEIPYWAIDDDQYKELIDDKLQEIARCN